MAVFPEKDNTRILVFVNDFHSYHIPLIREGVEEYFEQCERSLAFVQMDLTELNRYFGASIDKRMAVIGVIRHDELMDYLEEMDIPYLNLNVSCSRKSRWGLDIRFEGVGGEAADYFIKDLGVSQLGFIGRKGEYCHEQRLREFRKVAGRKNIEVKEFWGLQRENLPLYDYLRKYRNEQDLAIRQCLEQLEKPAGIFCGDDRIALDCYFNCEVSGIDVPDKVAILGVGSRSHNKTSWANIVSVVELDHRRLGYRGARLIDEFFGGAKTAPVRLRPSGIQHNQTTVRKRIGDPLMQKVFKMIVENPELQVTEIAERVDMTRKALDNRFFRATNTTIHKIIEQERFKKAKDLLCNRNYTIESIAGLAGYPNRKSMRRSFQRFTRMTPQKFREWNRNKGQQQVS